MARRFGHLLIVAAMWGMTFLLIRVAARQLTPLQILWARLAFGAVTVTPYAVWRFGGRELWRQLRPLFLRLTVTCLVTFVVPTLCFSWAEKPGRIDSGLAATIQASTPLFGALLVLVLLRSDVIKGWRLVGLFIGFGGVALLVGAQPQGDIAAALVVAFASVNYALAAIFTARWLGGVHPLAAATGMLWIVVLALLPVVAILHPAHVPNWKTGLSTFTLGFVCTGIGFLLYLALIKSYGASFGLLLNYLVPAFALFYGALILSETVTGSKLLGLAIVLVGVALGSGVIKRRRVAVELAA